MIAEQLSATAETMRCDARILKLLGRSDLAQVLFELAGEVDGAAAIDDEEAA